MADLIGLREYARRRGVTLSTVQAAIAAGRISVVNHGKGRVFIDPTLADKEWERNTTNPKRQDPDKPKGPTYADSRAYREAYRAKIAELEFKQMSGKLIDSEEVKLKWAALVAITKTKIMAIPTKAKSQIPHLGLDEIGVLESLVREALNEIADGRE